MNKTKTNAEKNLISDIKSGFLVFLIALPLCLGIATASGFPPISGIFTAIIGGCIISWLGGSKLTIKGPAAGLIVIVIGSVTELGQGDMLLGYHRTLAVGVVAAIIQMILASCKTANLGISVSKSVVHGMLAAIGIIIIAKQAHIALGVTPQAQDIIGLIIEIPQSLLKATPIIAIIGVSSLIFLLIWSKLNFKITKIIPPQIIILASVIPLSIFFNIENQYLIQLPDSMISAIAFPDFSAIFTSSSIKYIIMFSLVGMIETTLSVIAVDQIDKKQKSNLNRDLMGVGFGNLLSSLIGGLPMISEIVRSKANIDNGAKSSKANFFHGLFLLIFVLTIPQLLNLIPLSALAAMLIFVGLRLASISEIMHIKKIGWDQLILFFTTLITTLATDLLIGVTIGIITKIILHLLRGATIKSLFLGKIKISKEGSDTIKYTLYGTAAFPNLLHLSKKFKQIDKNIKKIIIDLSNTNLIDNTFLSGITSALAENSPAKLEIIGIENHQTTSNHPHSSRIKRKK
jgi:MFS superfamily sulfate permease-like transporter